MACIILQGEGRSGVQDCALVPLLTESIRKGNILNIILHTCTPFAQFTSAIMQSKVATHWFSVGGLPSISLRAFCAFSRIITSFFSCSLSGPTTFAISSFTISSTSARSTEEERERPEAQLPATERCSPPSYMRTPPEAWL